MPVFLYNQDFFLSGRLKLAIKKLLGKKNSGPAAVFGSLTRGLTNLQADFKVNQNIVNPVEVVCVLSGANVLAWAVEQKRAGKIKFLLAGPNVVYTSNDNNGLIARAEVDVCLVPSQQVKTAYERYNPKLLGRIYVWYTGVNEQFWTQDNRAENRKSILLYSKNAPEELILQAKSLVENLGFKALRVNYGKYSAASFKAALSQSKASIFFSQSESQGIALAESWSMDVPTFVWNPKKPHPHFADMTDDPAPFLSKATGEYWENVEQLKSLVTSLTSNKFSPRQWVLQNMTDSVCAKLFLNLVNQLKNK